MITIAIDYDGTMKRSSTYHQAECALWRRIILDFGAFGAECIIATARHGSSEDIAEIQEFVRRMVLPGLTIVWCGERPKAEACAARGYSPDIWIDDMPEMVRGNAFPEAS